MGQSRWVLALVAVFLTGCAAPLPDLPPTPSTQAPLPPGAGDFASGHFDSPLSVGDAEHILLRTEVFAMGGMPPKRQVQAFNVLVDRADATERFRSISERGTLAGRLYALCALSQLDASHAGAADKIMKAIQDKVLFLDGDVARAVSVSDMVGRVRERRIWDELKREKDETNTFFSRVR